MGVHAKAQYIQDLLASSGVPAQVVELPDAARTAADAAAALGTSVAQIAKSLVFRTDTRVVLAIASGINRVSTDRLAGQLGEPVTQPDAKATKNLTGYSAGGVPPVGHVKNPPISFVDEDLLRYETIWAAAGTPHTVFPISPDDLVRVTGAKIIRVAA
jgi:prolyl-tRNA editing enzyme YbaK/EbsC (Cys-tRNA(Pro) deacylase)